MLEENISNFYLAVMCLWMTAKAKDEKAIGRTEAL